jgi:hypothetical protein
LPMPDVDPVTSAMRFESEGMTLLRRP